MTGVQPPPTEQAIAAAPQRLAAFNWPALDGLRGVAVIAVIVFHAASALAPNGFAGVDIFFGLSGFLITALLLRERHNNGRISLPQFYVRRILRLYPALVLACLGVLALAVASGNLAEGGAAVLAALLYVAHLWIYTGHGGWLLEHTWTLSLEEHYYLVWPGLVMGFLSRSWRWLAFLSGGILLFVLASPWVLPHGIQAAYVRGTPMIFGSLAAFAWWRFRSAAPSAAVSALSNIAVVALLVLSFWPRPISPAWLTGATSVPGILAVLLVVGIVVAPRSLASRTLDWSPLKWTGRRAYGLYLYHFPILSLMAHQVDTGLPSWVDATIGVTLSFVVAAVSYRWVELPFLRQKARFSPVR